MKKVYIAIFGAILIIGSGIGLNALSKTSYFETSDQAVQEPFKDVQVQTAVKEAENAPAKVPIGASLARDSAPVFEQAEFASQKTQPPQGLTGKVKGYIPLNPLPDDVTPTDDSYEFDPNDGNYHPSIKNPPRIFVYEITFHEGFRPEGLKALDVHVIARSNGETDNTLVRDRDEIVSVTGSTGKVYDMAGSKGTGVTLNYENGNYHEERIIQYKDISIDEEYIDNVVVRRDGKLITLDAKNAKLTTTHP
ncbi:hypothetical protein [Desulfitobacterium sp. PCE1]|uniref:hypothetical protein n=1 Tax=Desulfitobacterium sp. PCE1 TaxID=146907 RepID=UPI00037CF422|nr:hypothetical protein [Desulfitobacterium sp. PCE1]